MTDDPKNVFEFDPLPGDTKPAASENTLAHIAADIKAGVFPKKSKRGRKPKEPKVTKPERKKRGPRRVQAAQVTGIVLKAGTATVTTAPIKKTRKPRRTKADPPELFFIQRMMHLSEKKRKHILDVLNKIFA